MRLQSEDIKLFIQVQRVVQITTVLQSMASLATLKKIQTIFPISINILLCFKLESTSNSRTSF